MQKFSYNDFILNNYQKLKDFILNTIPLNSYKELKNKKNMSLGTAFIIFVIVLCSFQIVRGVFLNTTKYIVLSQKVTQLEKINKSAKEKNAELKTLLTTYHSTKGIEALGRDDLKLAASDEVLVLIKN